MGNTIRDLIQKKAELLTKTNDQDLKRKHVKKAIKSAIDSMNQNNLRKHVKKAIKSAIDSMNQNNELINTLQNQLNSENEMCLSQKNEKDHFESLVKQMKKKTSYLEDRCQMLAFEENKYKSKIEKQKSLIDWAESVLQETNSELDQEDNVLDLMEKYQMQDRDQFKEDELKRQKLLKDLKQAENILQNEVQELKAKDVEYEQIVKMCRNLNKERNSLIDQWEYSMKILKLRDADICVVEKQIESLEKEVGEESLKLEEEKKNHEEELRTNQERAQTRQYYFNQCNGLRASLQQVEKQLFDLKHEKRYLRTHLLELENDKQVHKCHIRNLQAQIKDKSNRLSALQQKREGLKHKLDNIDSEVKTTDETVKQLNSLLKNERNTQSNLIKEIEKLSRHLSAKALETASLRSQYEINTREIVANEAKLCQLLREENKTLELLSKQGDLLHKHSCQLESIQKQILGIQGLHSDEFMKAKTRELNVLIDKKKEIEKCWDTARRESKKMDVEIAKTMLQIKKDRNTLAELKDNLTVTKVAVDGKQKLLAQLEDKNQELAVQESLLQLRLQQSKNQMLKHTNQVYSLEKARIEMESSIQAGMSTIAADSYKSHVCYGRYLK
ncbi:coiled-coil domain-containing protein 39 [Diaphorina citri]|uniref:Coiled-coil domain-containing protein 39 n=1 Tax=Diaphorina citri TaxID=121845 RepID=A0A3Q0IUL4_DIACI|nr:coiled-coil domain-containing protein 39 [Diaphorina citri]